MTLNFWVGVPGSYAYTSTLSPFKLFWLVMVAIPINSALRKLRSLRVCSKLLFLELNIFYLVVIFRFIDYSPNLQSNLVNEFFIFSILLYPLIHVCAACTHREQKMIASVFLYHTSFYFLETMFLTQPEVLYFNHAVCSMSSQDLPASVPSAGVTGIQSHAWLLHGMLGTWTQILARAQWTLLRIKPIFPDTDRPHFFFFLACDLYFQVSSLCSQSCFLVFLPGCKNSLIKMFLLHLLLYFL